MHIGGIWSIFGYVWGILRVFWPPLGRVTAILLVRKGPKYAIWAIQCCRVVLSDFWAI